MYKNLIAIALLATALLITTAACQSQSATKDVEVKLALSEFKFTPDTIRVQVGNRVQVTLDNSKGALKHTMKQADLGIDASVEAGQTTTFQFTASKAGTFDFDCDVLGHKDAGMVGKIIVQP